MIPTLMSTDGQLVLRYSPISSAPSPRPIPLPTNPLMYDEDMSRRRVTASSDEDYHAEDPQSDYSAMDQDAPCAVDFGSVALYVPGLQVTLALVACCAATILTSLASTLLAVSAVRTATLSALVGFAIMFRPIRLAYARGIDLMFDALRPALAVYMMALIFEQLVHSCGPPHVGEALSARHWIFHSCSVLMGLAGFAQAIHPRAHDDYPFIVVALSLTVISILTPPPWPGEGPLCEPPTTAGAIERLVRALFFGGAYCSMAYASAPVKHSVKEVALCAIKATAGSIWILCIHRYLMWGAIVQTGVVLWARMRASRSGFALDMHTRRDRHARWSSLPYDSPYRDLEADEADEDDVQQCMTTTYGPSSSQSPPPEAELLRVDRQGAEVLGGDQLSQSRLSRQPHQLHQRHYDGTGSGEEGPSSERAEGLASYTQPPVPRGCVGASAGSGGRGCGGCAERHCPCSSASASASAPGFEDPSLVSGGRNEVLPSQLQQSRPMLSFEDAPGVARAMTMTRVAEATSKAPLAVSLGNPRRSVRATGPWAGEVGDATKAPLVEHPTASVDSAETQQEHMKRIAEQISR